MKAFVFTLALMAAAGFLTASCATDSYRPYEAGAGYSEERLDDTHWRVAFVGSVVESQPAVEQQLLRRAAELTVERGYDWFTPTAQGSQREESVVVTGERPRLETGGSVGSVWRPHWRRRSASRWTDWDPQGAVATEQPPPAPSSDVTTELRYSATAEITMGRSPAPQNAFDARAILAGAQQP
jgi:hypothetical protein